MFAFHITAPSFYATVQKKTREHTKGTKPSGNDGNMQPFNVS